VGISRQQVVFSRDLALPLQPIFVAGTSHREIPAEGYVVDHGDHGNKPQGQAKESGKIGYHFGAHLDQKR
jgi:hypothetical protein